MFAKSRKNEYSKTNFEFLRDNYALFDVVWVVWNPDD